MGIVVVPLVITLLFRWLLPRKVWRWIAFACTLLIWALVGYGFTVGFEQLEVRHVEYVSSDVPEAFDGYRIVHFSDAHVGTLTGSRQWMLQRAVDSINAQHADMIVFTGDLQNLRPDELAQHLPQLRQLHASDGVYSILGNHDYPMYLTDNDATKARYLRQTKQLERQAGWQLLLNEHRFIRRGADSICLAGMENWGKAERMPHDGDVHKTMAGVPSSLFTIMLQHDPTAWREKILPECHAQLTLSGHTHGGQMALFGITPVSLSYSEWGGGYREGSRTLFVSTGLGGLIPFRIGLPGEIVVITLKSKKVKG
jgi:hypothetical protein